MNFGPSERHPLPWDDDFMVSETTKNEWAKMCLYSQKMYIFKSTYETKTYVLRISKENFEII